MDMISFKGSKISHIQRKSREWTLCGIDFGDGLEVFQNYRTSRRVLGGRTLCKVCHSVTTSKHPEGHSSQPENRGSIREDTRLSMSTIRKQITELRKAEQATSSQVIKSGNFSARRALEWVLKMEGSFPPVTK